MATRSTIAMKTPEGKIRAIYCHWDGYPEHNGKMLLDNYQDAAKNGQEITRWLKIVIKRFLNLKETFRTLKSWHKKNQIFGGFRQYNRRNESFILYPKRQSKRYLWRSIKIERSNREDWISLQDKTKFHQRGFWDVE